MTTHNLFQYDRMLLYRSAPDTLRVIGESTASHDTWDAHAALSDSYSIAYKDAIVQCRKLIVEYKELASFDVVDRAHFVPNIESLMLNGCARLTHANIAFANISSLSIAGTALTDAIFTQIRPQQHMRLVDVSNTRNITYVPCAETINAGHSLVTTILPGTVPIVRLVANDSRLTTVQASPSTSTILWAYPGKTLTITGGSSNLTVLTPQEPSDIICNADISVLRISYYGEY
jgi:hypothetical protein